MIKRVVLYGATLLLLFSCVNRHKGEAAQQQPESEISFAEYITISADTILSVNNWESTEAHLDKYVLVPADSAYKYKDDPYVIGVPVRSCISMSTTYLPHLKLLGEASTVKALSGTAFVYDTLYRRMIAEGALVDIGADSAPNYEKIISLNPDVVLVYGVGGADNSYIKKFRTLGLKVIVVNDYLENTPVGKLEYIKLFGALTGKREVADSIFTSLRQEYESVRESVRKASEAPTKVLVNLPFKNIWYVPGGENFITALIKDAGGEVLGSKEGERFSSQEAWETMYTLATQAQVWIHLNNLATLDGVAEENALYKNLPVFKSGLLYNNTKRTTPTGGSDFWEGGVVEPHEILKDLVQIIHPEVAQAQFPGRELKYYFKLQ